MTASPSAPRRCAIYVRISDDKAEDAAGVGRQEKDCRALAARRGWAVGEVYVENDTSAYKRRKVRLPDGTTGLRVIRPEFRRMLEDLSSGLADGLIAYDLDRIARDPRDLEDLIEAVELKGIPTDAATGQVDLSTDNGIFVARMLVNVANKSSKDTSRRVKRKQADLAAAGIWKGGGHRPFGYNADGVTVRPDEARVLRKMAKWVLAGDSMNTIAKRLEAQGVVAARGGASWSARSVHSVITKPRVAGLTSYMGEILGPGQWPAILDQDTWERVKLALDARSNGSTNALRRWLTGLLLCGRCGQPLAGMPGNHGGRYWCNSTRGGCGKIAINGPRIETYVETMILTYLSRPEVLATLQETTSAASAAKARRELRDDEEQLKEAAALWAAKRTTTAEYMVSRRDIEQRIEQWRQVLNASLPRAIRDLEPGRLAETWAAAGPVERREICRAVFPTGIRIDPATQVGFVGFDSKRIVPLDWVGDAADSNAAAANPGTSSPDEPHPGPGEEASTGGHRGRRAAAS